MTTHAVSVDYTRFDRMSPTAAALAALLHVLVALALWWLPQLTVWPEPNEDAIDVTIEPPEPVAPTTTAPPLPEAKPINPAPPVKPQSVQPPPPKAVAPPLGLPPPSPNVGETNKQVLPKTQEPARDPRPAPSTDAKPDVHPPEPSKPEKTTEEPPKPQPATEPSRQQALAPSAPPPPPLERELPPLEAPPPPLTSQDFARPPAPAPAPPVHQPARPAPPPAHNPAPNQALRPSPLTNPAPRHAPSESPSQAPSTSFVNPADTYSQAKIVEQYLWQVAARMSQYRYYSNQGNEQGVVVVRLVIARDGRLLDASVARSSGYVNLDKGVLDAARAASPYAPFPEGIPGAQQAFILPLSSVYRR